MKKIFTYMLAGLSLLLFSRCDALDIDPTSSIADSNYWKTEAQFSTFNVGLHALLRECSFNFFLLGEPRADIYGDVPFGGEATQGMERLPFNTINKENTGISNFAGMYKVINQRRHYSVRKRIWQRLFFQIWQILLVDGCYTDVKR